jgi:hypothetical protein
MKHVFVVFAAFVVTTLLACGGPVSSEPAEEELGQVEGALICSRANTCSFIVGTACPNPGVGRDCCLDGEPTGFCYCEWNRTWVCSES